MKKRRQSSNSYMRKYGLNTNANAGHRARHGTSNYFYSSNRGGQTLGKTC